MRHASEPAIVVKVGGSTLSAEDTSLDDVAALWQAGKRPVVVHGGGSAVTSWMTKLGARAEFVRGLRVTDAASLDMVTAVLAGLVNKQLVAVLQRKGAHAAGLSGADGGMLRGTVTDPALGFVAGAVEADARPVQALLAAGYVPVIAPLAVDVVNGYQLLNVNADTAAGAIAIALHAQHLVFLTDVDGILDSSGRLLQRVRGDMAETLIASGVVKGGMIPKVEACVQAARNGVLAHIVNGTRQDALAGCLAGTFTGTAVTIQMAQERR